MNSTPPPPPRLGQKIESLIGDFKFQIAIIKAFTEQIDLNSCDSPELFPSERMKNNYFVQPVDELRTEMLADNFQNRTFHFLITLITRFFLNKLRPKV